MLAIWYVDSSYTRHFRLPKNQRHHAGKRAMLQYKNSFIKKQTTGQP
jgi:hypothetical protein